MLVREARRQAREWVEREPSRTPGFAGAFLTGSTKWAAPEAVHRSSSDVDVRVIVDAEGAPDERKKSRYREILIEAAFVTRAELGSAESILADPYLSGSLWNPVLLADPSGTLAELADPVGAEFPRRPRVRERAGAARDIALAHFGRIRSAPSFAAQVSCWLFGTGVTTFIPLAAGLRNWTVRRRYAESRALLAEHDRLDLHEEMLSWLGCGDLAPADARRHLAALAGAYDATSACVDASFRFAADLLPDARPIAIDGSRELIDAGLHREAVFWLVSTFSRCVQGLRPDAPAAVRARCESGLVDLLADLGLATPADLLARADHTRAQLPRLLALADPIMDATPGIRP